MFHYSWEVEQLAEDELSTAEQAEIEEKDPISNNSQADIAIDQPASDTFTTEDSEADEASNKEILDKLDNGQVD